MKLTFWAKIDKSGGPNACWPWQLGKDKDGYGKVKIRGRSLRAHRVALSKHLKKKLNPDKLVMHKCDNPPCCNPKHLKEGWPVDNSQDRAIKGRGADRSGENHHLVKLSSEHVSAIRSFNWAGVLSQAAIGQLMHISQTQVGRIIRGTRWRKI